MHYLTKTSSKFGLIAVLLLLASACGGEENTRDGSENRDTVNPLVEIEEIAAGDECQHGGSLIINGVDKDKDGKLSESEILSTQAICKNAPGSGGGGGGASDGSPLIQTQTLDAGDENCPHGGQLVIAGLDADEDGNLSGDEIKSTSVFCTEVGACVGVPPLELVSAEIEQDHFGQHEIGQTYEIRVELNQAIDKSRVRIQDAAGSLGDGALDYEVDEDNDHIAILSWTPDEIGNFPILAMIEDGCSLAANHSQLPYVDEPRVQVRVTSEVRGLINEGDKAEICWTSRLADSCAFYEFNTLVGPVEPNGCMELELTPEQIAHPSSIIDYYIRCERTDDEENLTFRQHQALLYKQPILEYFYGEQPLFLEATGGTAKLYWNTFGMDSCTLSDGTDTNPVDAVPADPSIPHAVDITQSTDFTLTCEDLLNATHHQKVRYLVGPGITSISAALNVQYESISIVWGTVDLDGTCDVTYSNNGATLSFTDVTPGLPNDQNGFMYRFANVFQQNIDTSVFDLSKEQVTEVTCYNADKTESYTYVSTQ